MNDRKEFVSNAMKELSEFFQNEENYIFFGEWTYILDFFELMIQKLKEYYDKFSFTEHEQSLVDKLERMLIDIDRIRKEDYPANEDNLYKAINEFFSNFAEVFPLLWD
ncbi:MAG: hypothetical protein KatS3mg002_0400 [Candidatus Woesearchaeota archaeon]|nr:MAG: hypothetical protein KatS3mg002_0400 [Candidatus Woesearchaeota archaeon]